MRNLQIGGGRKEAAVDIWIEVSSVELFSGFREAAANRPLPVSSQQERRWIAGHSPNTAVVGQQ